MIDAQRGSSSCKPLEPVNGAIADTGVQGGIGTHSAADDDRAETTSLPEPRSADAQSLAYALRAGFGILRVLAAVLGIAFFVSNIYWVPEGSVALQSRLGMLLGEKYGNAVRRPGGPYFACPYPIDRVTKYPTSLREVAVENAFWLEGDESDLGDGSMVRGESLRPGVHGSLITGDKNLVQGTWIVRFQLGSSGRGRGADRDIVSFARTVGTIGAANELVRVLAEEAIVTVVAGTKVADFVAGRIDHERVSGLIQAKLDSLGAGLRVTGVSASTYLPPYSLADDFQAVTRAESEKALQIEKAVRYRISTLSEVAGEQWELLLEHLNAYELTRSDGDPQARRRSLKRAEELVLSGMLGGQVAQQLDRARTDKTRTIERARAAALRFDELLPAYRRDPLVLKEQLRQEALAQLYADPTSRVHISPSKTRVFLNMESNDNQ